MTAARTRPSDSPIEVAGRVQRGIERFYSLEQAPFIGAFMRTTYEGERERVVIRDADDGDIEIEVVAPALLPDPGLDDVCQLIEGVSHFVHVADRARRNLPTTHLELELQAEVDKYVLLVLDSDTFDPGSARSMHARLYERVRFRDAEGTEEGERYRLANDLAARFVRRLEVLYAAKGRRFELRSVLSRFYAMGQADKIGFARAA